MGSKPESLADSARLLRTAATSVARADLDPKFAPVDHGTTDSALGVGLLSSQIEGVVQKRREPIPPNSLVERCLRERRLTMLAESALQKTGTGEKIKAAEVYVSVMRKLLLVSEASAKTDKRILV
jgi:hypothetical protein